MVKFLFPVLLAHSLSCLSSSVNAVPANIVINAENILCNVSPYMRGLNSYGAYYKAPMTDPVMIAKLKRADITMLRFPPGAIGSRHDFKYNDYKGRTFRYSYNAETSEWTTWWDGDIEGPQDRVPSLEEELRFCNAIGAEPCIELNTAFEGPNATDNPNALGGKRWGGDFESYTGITLPDTPENRAKYAVDMVVHIRSLCQANGWAYPVYYNIGNESNWEGQTPDSYAACFKAYKTEILKVDPNIKVFGLVWYDTIVTPTPIQLTDFFDCHFYPSSGLIKDAHAPGFFLDGSFASYSGIAHYNNLLKEAIKDYRIANPGKDPVFTASEWGDEANDGDVNPSIMGVYKGAMYNAHMLYRLIKHKFILSCEWYIWAGEDEDLRINMFGGPPLYKERPRYFTYMMYSKFGSELVECYDSSEYTPGVTDYFDEYKDDRDDLLTLASKTQDGNLSIMAINLSEATTYQADINLQNFAMSGDVVAYTMGQSNCYEGGPGPSTTTFTGQSNPISFTFNPFTITCLIVNKVGAGGDTTPPSPVQTVNDGTGTDVDSTTVTTQLAVNWTPAADSESGISKYYFAIGSLPGGTNIINWTDNGPATNVTRTNLSLTINSTYYFSVKAQNGVGLWSGITSSDGILVSNPVVEVPDNEKLVDSLGYPNPVNFSEGQEMIFKVNGGEVKIYSLSGKLARSLASGQGTDEIKWDGSNEHGEKVARGIYLYIITNNDGNKFTGKFAVVSAKKNAFK